MLGNTVVRCSSKRRTKLMAAAIVNDTDFVNVHEQAVNSERKLFVILHVFDFVLSRCD